MCAGEIKVQQQTQNTIFSQLAGLLQRVCTPQQEGLSTQQARKVGEEGNVGGGARCGIGGEKEKGGKEGEEGKEEKEERVGKGAMTMI